MHFLSLSIKPLIYAYVFSLKIWQKDTLIQLSSRKKPKLTVYNTQILHSIN